MEKTVICGYVDHIIYQNAENGYTVMVVSDEKSEITVTGVFRGIDTGERVRIEGVIQEHPSYGEQLRMENYEVLAPDDRKSIERYLGSGAIKGVGEKLAQRIVKRFGEDTFRIIEEEPERLTEIKGISERIARQIAEQVYEKREMRRAMLFLQGYGITDKLAVKIYERYGEGMYDMLQTNPYRMAEDIEGVGFKRADEIAQNAGILVNSEYRIRCGLLYTLSQALAGGHTCLPESMLLTEGSRLLLVAAEELKVQLTNLVMDHKVFVRQEECAGEVLVYSPVAYRAENQCAALLRDLDICFFEEGEGYLSKEESMIYDKIHRIEDESGIVLDDMQRQAVLKAIQRGVMILTGGPGTGKTTTIHAMLKYFEREQMQIELAAPTGRAAKRMSEACGMEARTIHRLLEVSGASDDGKTAGFLRDINYPLEADVVIVDEMSMVDVFLFQALLSAIPQGTRLILVGDVDQLPSVGPGCILKDLIESGCYSTVMLNKIFRQAAESDIVMNAHRIHDGKMPEIKNKESKDFYFLKREDPNVMYKHMVELVTDRLPRYVGASPLDIQVLTPMKKGAMGVESLNGILQQYINPPEKGKREYLAGDVLFREGDKVMQTKNNYQLEWEITGKFQLPIANGVGVFNGDIGVIREINEYASLMKVEFDEGKTVNYRFEELDELELAYAITIHKSQGSEYPAVVIPLWGVPGLLTYRNLLYTAVTRAKKCVTILGSDTIMEHMILGENKQKRYTGLRYRICEGERMRGKDFA
ncbi:MAG: ATP-dependent RecD-like DNA helicase [Lachnospiraceae bacterium]|nr:ATP-dependent RecD-like DNA helicase [Lachnospiraceae bacterium]